ncbi:NAD(P)/FAD-dependent oxidoreductase [Nonomuraea gerenzanensis]|uniref:NAD(P)/FAD-dependent oxidoreductase n=1 Tax=Nonomuraea gerenzanensis TaxID=93944 RepID=UPI001CD99470|nr:FAD-dependent oxidoreductase [Nonomuraea gerenzanensis]UBU08726.1 FAD-binding oxidoreductase [Nonomuraea gerenzanensis]
MSTGSRVVVIGGGVIGLSIAFHLAEAGQDVTLLERGTLGSGASRATADVVRSYFAGNPVSSSLAVRSLEAYRAFATRPGTPLPLRQVGYLVLFTEPEQLAAFNADLAAQRAAGVDVELIGPDEAREHNPLIGDLPLLGAAYSPDAYISDTTAIVNAYAQAAELAGAALRTGCPVTAIDPEAGRVQTADGEISADAIVCAAGAWSASLVRCAGVDMPLTEPIEQELLTTDPLPPGTPQVPVTLHAASGLLIRNRDDRLLIGMGYPGPDRESWRKDVAVRLAETYPSLAGIGLHTAVTGLRDASPDKTAFIGHQPGPPAFLYATGFSGHGLCNAPAAGELVRDLYLDRDPGMDVTALAVGPTRTGMAS